MVGREEGERRRADARASERAWDPAEKPGSASERECASAGALLARNKRQRERAKGRRRGRKRGVEARGRRRGERNREREAKGGRERKREGSG
eukprot:3169524-Pleurochrysis_carterae.AAC.1